MRERTGRGAGDHISQAGGAALGNDDAVRARGKSRADDGAEVVRVFDTVEKNDQALLRCVARGALEESFESGCGARSGERDDALMLARAGQTVHLRPVFEAHGHAAAARQPDEIFDAVAVSAARNDDAAERPARFQGFVNGVNTGETFHGLIERGAEFENALARAFHSEPGLRGQIEKQDDAIEFTFARPARKREANGMEQLAAAQCEARLERGDNLLVAVGINRTAFENQKS